MLCFETSTYCIAGMYYTSKARLGVFCISSKNIFRECPWLQQRFPNAQPLYMILPTDSTSYGLYVTSVLPFSRMSSKAFLDAAAVSSSVFPRDDEHTRPADLLLVDDTPAVADRERDRESTQGYIARFSIDAGGAAERVATRYNIYIWRDKTDIVDQQRQAWHAMSCAASSTAVIHPPSK